MSRTQTTSTISELPIIQVPFESIIVPEGGNNTSRFAPPSQAKIEQLAQNIRERATLQGLPMGRGLLQPVLVNGPSETGTYRLVAGYQRMAALKSLADAGEEVSPVVVNVLGTQTTEEEDLVNIDENVMRNDLGLMDMAKSGAKLKDAGHPLDAIAARFGHKKAWAGTVIGFMDLPKEYQDKLQDGTLPFRAGRELVTLNRSKVENAAELMAIYVTRVDAGMTVERAVDKSKDEGRKASTKGRKSAEDEVPEPAKAPKKGLSSKAAILECKDVVDTVKAQEEADPFDKKVAQIMGIFAKMLAGGASTKVTQKKIYEVVAA